MMEMIKGWSDEREVKRSEEEEEEEEEDRNGLRIDQGFAPLLKNTNADNGAIRERANNNNNNNNNVGKRFARRAKRWADLQQRRMNARHCGQFVDADSLNQLRNSSCVINSRCVKSRTFNEDVNFYEINDKDMRQQDLLLPHKRDGNFEQMPQRNCISFRCACDSNAITDVTSSIMNSTELLEAFGADVLKCKKCKTFVLHDMAEKNSLMEPRRGPHAICRLQYKYYLPLQTTHCSLVQSNAFYLLNVNPQVRTAVTICQHPSELFIYPQINDATDSELVDQVFKYNAESSDYFSQSSCSSKSSSNISRSSSSSVEEEKRTHSRRRTDGVRARIDHRSLSSRNSIDELSSVPSGSLSPLRFGLTSDSDSDYLSVTTNPPPERDWISVRHYDPEKHCAAFTILSYNILSDRCTQRLPYTSCPPWALSWDYRCAHIVKEIKHYEADIFTLQEVETEDFYAFFSDEFKDLGYDGIYSPRARARTMEEEGRKTVDGCAIFWKRDKFEFKYQHTIEFTQVLLSGPVTITNRVLLDKLLPRDNIALCAVLIVKEDIYETKRRSISSDPSVVGYPLLVCTAHIYWDPTFSDIKLIQSMVLMKELTSFLCKIKDTFNCRIDQFPLVLCGDFNSLPDSGLIEFITSGSVLKAHNEFNSTYDECLEELTSEKEQRVYTHDLKLYNAIERGYLEFTNYTLEFRGMIDYIFASSKRLTRLGFLGSVSQNWITENHIRGFPYIHVPSDHIPIMAQFEILPIDDFPYD